MTSAVLAIAPLWEAIAKDAQRSAAECFPDTARDPSAFEPIIGTRIRASIPLTNFDPSES